MLSCEYRENANNTKVIDKISQFTSLRRSSHVSFRIIGCYSRILAEFFFGC